MGRPKISILGAGATGTATAHFAVERELGDLVIYDIVEGLPQARALDLWQAGPIRRFDLSIKGTNDLKDTKDSDILIITAGKPRQPGMSRADLLSVNSQIVGDLALKGLEYSPDAFIIVLTNPVDGLTWAVKKKTGLPRERVMGQAGVLDSTRYRAFLAEAIGVSMRDVQAMVLGGHGDAMVPLVGYANVAGIPIRQLLPEEKIQAIVERTRKGGGEIVNLLKTGSASEAPGAALVEMAEAILRDQKRVLPVTAYLEGEYGYRDICLGVPVILGRGGVERILEIPLDEEDRKALQVSAEEVQGQIRELAQLA
ncbi:MAG: malate dehydrogenase [Clostridiales bacterium]|nr:malate dehydrogenase [Clostridiales bacterium]